MKEERLFVTLAFGIGLTLALLWILGSQSLSAIAAPSAGPVEAANVPAAELHVCLSGCAYSSVQAAVDAASEGDIIKVATGTYNDVHVRPRNDTSTNGVVTQVVYISKTVIIQGGYTITNWTNPDPGANPATLDAQKQGRVLYITGSISPTIEGLHITGGDATGLGGGPSGRHAGGGVYVVTATVSINNNWVFSNTADKPSSGGGLYLSYSDAALSGNSVTSNTANYGGGLYCGNDSRVVLVANVIGGNTALDGQGGGLFLHGSPQATLVSNTIINNQARRYSINHGGGIYCTSSQNVMLTANVISGNLAFNDGGGLYLLESENVELVGNRIIKNHSGFGGGLFLNESNNAVLVNNVVVDNQANSAGSGLYIAGSSPHLLHTTIARNAGGDGSGVYITDATSTAFLTNTMLVSHTVGITVAAGNTATLYGMLWYSNTINCNRCTVTNEYTGNPAFAADGYHLTRDSAAVDRGVTSTVAIDIDGDARPQGSGYDLGADEFVYNIYLPFMLRSYVTS